MFDYITDPSHTYFDNDYQRRELSFYFLLTFVYFTISMDIPPARLKNPPINTAFLFENAAKVTKKGAAIFPKFDIASEIPKPVERIEVGNVSAEIKLNKAKATVLKSRLAPINNKSPTFESVNYTQMPSVPDSIIRTMIQNFLFILWQKKLVKKQLPNQRQPMTNMFVSKRYPQSSTEYCIVQQNPLLQICAKLSITKGITYLAFRKVSFISIASSVLYTMPSNEVSSSLLLKRAIQLRFSRVSCLLF